MPESVKCVLRLRGVERREKGVKRPLLQDINAELREGRLVALVGADGAGKTTLMRIMAGILPPTEGTVEILGEDLYKDVDRLQRHCGYMPQKFGLYEDLSVEENFILYADLFGLTQAERRERIQELLEMTGLGPFTQRPAGKLSGGMKQKLGLACALLNHPKILLLDEPSVGVDPLSRRQLWEILQKNARTENMTVVVATTYMDEAQLCDDVLILEDGLVRLWDQPENIARKALGKTFQAKDRESGRRPVRLLQAALLDSIDYVNDAVPEADGVRVLLRKAEDIQVLRTKFAEVDFLERTPTLEDGYLCYCDALQTQKRQLQNWDWIVARDVETDSEVIDARDLVRKFGDFVAVDQTSFRVAPGEIFGLLGPNGAGKTTTFKMLCGLLEVTSGTLSVAGVDVREYREEAREQLGYMSQKFALYAGLSVTENFDFFAGAYGLTGKAKKERISLLAKAFELDDKLSIDAGALSGGYKQRLSMAVALLHQPQILFLDEPTSGADIPTRRQFWRWMTELAATGTTIVVTTHFMQEALYCDRILIQDAGKTLVLGTPQEVRGTRATMNEAFIDIVEAARETEVCHA